MKNTTIKDNSVGVQAGRDLTVTQTVNHLPESMQNMFLEILKPSVEQIGENLKNEISTDVSKSIGKKIRTVLEEGFVKSIREQIKEKNLNYHIEMVIKKIHEDDKKDNRSREELHKTFQKVDLFLEWVECAEDISAKDSTLSEIWQNWLYKLSQSRDSSNQKILLNKMKQLTPEDAEILLRFRGNRFRRLTSNLNTDDKLSYLTKKLIDMGLLKRFYYHELFSFISSLVFIFALLTFGFDEITRPEIITQLEPSFYLFSLLFPILIYNQMPSYKLTWIGKEILSYSYAKIYSLRANTFENLKNEGIPKEIISVHPRL